MPRSKSPTNPDSYMPYFGGKFESAVKGYPAYVKWSYLASLWHYWSHTHCTGIPNDEAYLRRVSDCETEHWGAVKQAIFSENGLFSLGKDNKWHQKFCSELYEDRTLTYRSIIEKSKKGNATRWGIPQGIPGGVPQGIPKSSQTDAEADVLKNVCVPDGFPSTEREAMDQAQFAGVPPEFAVKTWNKANGRGGRDSRNVEIRNFRSYLKTEYGYEQERQANGKTHSLKVRNAI